MNRFLGWLSCIARIGWQRVAGWGRGRAPIFARGVRGRVAIRRFAAVSADPPPMHWAPCHPSTVRRFKASMTCPNGHGLTLRGHSIASNGDVSPSVVCPELGCAFHEFVRLKRWSFGAMQ